MSGGAVTAGLPACYWDRPRCPPPGAQTGSWSSSPRTGRGRPTARRQSQSVSTSTNQTWPLFDSRSNAASASNSHCGSSPCATPPVCPTGIPVTFRTFGSILSSRPVSSSKRSWRTTAHSSLASTLSRSWPKDIRRRPCSRQARTRSCSCSAPRPGHPRRVSDRVDHSRGLVARHDTGRRGAPGARPRPSPARNHHSRLTRRAGKNRTNIRGLVEPTAAPSWPGTPPQRLPNPSARHPRPARTGSLIPRRLASRGRSAGLAEPVGEGDKFVAPVGAHPDHHQQAHRVLLEANLHVNAVDPHIDISVSWPATGAATGSGQRYARGELTEQEHQERLRMLGVEADRWESG